MNVISMKISDVKPYANNPRDNDSAVGGVAESIKQFGWQQPIVVDKDNVIIVGHTRYKAAKELGLKEVPVVVASKLTPEQVKAYRLADNKTGEQAIWDNKQLLEELGSIDMSKLFTGFKSSDVFDDVLDESDNQPIDENDKGVTYTVTLKTQDKETYDKVKNFVDSVAMLDD